MQELAQHVIAAIGWDRDRQWGGTREVIEHALALGVGGFLIRGGPRADVAQLARALHAHSRVPLLIAADAERGAGERFHGAVALPPAGALAALDDREAVRRASHITARDLRDAGINWLLGPVCDLDFNNDNPIIGPRAFGGDPQRVGELCADWIDACQAENVLACAKHFPGHGRTLSDSHTGLPVEAVSVEELLTSDLVPFRAAVDSGVASVMTAHVAFTALDPHAVSATCSAPTLRLLREELGFPGLIVSDALEMQGARAAQGESEAAVAALGAGCDLLLAPTDPDAIVRAIAGALADGRLDANQLATSRMRRDWWATWARWLPTGRRGPTLDDRAWAKQVSDRVLRIMRGRLPWIPPVCEVVVVDDDPAEFAPSRVHFVEAVQALGRTVRVVEGATATGEGPLVITVFADIVPGKGHVSISAPTRLAVRLAVQSARTLKRDSLVVLFGHPRLADALPDAAHLLCAWSGDRGMQEAAARAVCS